MLALTRDFWELKTFSNTIIYIVTIVLIAVRIMEAITFLIL